MQKELKRPWEKQNMNTVHFLIECQAKYPTAVNEEFLQSSLQTEKILTPLAFKHLGRIFWSPSSVMIAITHPAYETFGRFLWKSNPHAMEFWNKELREILLAPTKLKEIATLRILTAIFNEKKIESLASSMLLTNPIISMITKSLRTTKQDKREDYMTTQYNEFFDAIEAYMGSLPTDHDNEVHKFCLIRNFIEHPGTLMIEKYASTRFIHKMIGKLTREGIDKLFELYRDILLEKTKKNGNEPWLHTEKEHCIQMMQLLMNQKSVQHDHLWRAERLKFFFKFGIFFAHKTNTLICPKDDCPDPLPTDSAYKLKQGFFASLQSKVQKLSDERSMLLKIVQYFHEYITGYNDTLLQKRPNPQKSMRHPLSEKAIQSWRKMYETVTAKKKGKQVLHDVFDVLMMHMGLQLFVQTEMAIFSIDDLEKCLERSQKKLKEKKSKTKQPTESNEAEWIEVVVDLFLQLLSQNKSFLRNVVDNVFPRLCDNLNSAAIDQILMMLDMSEKNPLTNQGGASEDNEEDEDDDSENENDENGENSDNSSENEESSEEEDDEMLDEEESIADDDETATDKLRSILSQALAGDDDADSVDLNDMDDAEAERLDMVLSDAFKSMNRKSNGSKKKTKLERTTNTVVMHFRIRVLDLLEIYLKTNPSLAITLNILTDLIPMYEHCIAVKDLEPLVNRLNRVLRTLLQLREFSNVDGVSEAKLYELFHSIINVKVNSAGIEQNKLTSQFCAFLIAVSQSLKSSEPILLETIAECLEHFLKSRNPTVQFAFFDDIMRLRWNGVWRLSQIITKTSLVTPTNSRAFRRFQALELLAKMYKNLGFIAHDINEFNEMNKKIEAGIEVYINWLKKESNVSPKEFSGLLQLLRELHKISETVKSYECSLDWPRICDSVQSIRKRTELLSFQMYSSFCKLLKINVIKNSEVNLAGKKAVAKNVVTNGNTESGSDDDEEISNQPQNINTNGKAKKRKLSDSSTPNGLSTKRKAKLAKKLRKENRLKMSSVGLEGVSFNTTPNANDDDDLDSD